MTTPRLLICGFGAFPEAPLNPSAAVIEALSREGWAPGASEIQYETLPVAWRGSVQAILAHATPGRFDGVLVVGVAVEADAFRVETLGRNVANPDRVDHAGERWSSPVIAADAPAALPATAPWRAMLERLAAADLAAHASEDAGDYLCNFTLYSLLAEAAAPAVGFLHVPQARECDANAAFVLADIDRAIRACVHAFVDDIAAVKGRAA